MSDESWLGLRHLALRVRDLEACRGFYVDFLGMQVEWEPDPDNLYLTSGSDNLALHRSDETGAGALDHLGFVLSDPEAVATWEQKARDAGVEIVQATKTHRDGAVSFYCRDPEGNTVQILFHPPIARDAARRG
jgi:catechol 2,3-dioxygenase-like lactoylglutathione lyase family enzyme